MDATTLAAFVEHQRFFAGLPGAIRSEIISIFAAVSDHEDVSANTVLFEKGDSAADEGILVLDGEISIEKDGHPVKYISGPELMGEMSQFNPTGQRTATVSAVKDLQLLRFQWFSLKNEVRRRLGPTAVDALQTALEEFAWNHFTE